MYENGKFFLDEVEMNECQLVLSIGNEYKIPNVGYNRDLICRTWGQYNYETFDGLYYYYPGNCTYTLVRECQQSEHSFLIQIHNDPACKSSSYSCQRSVSLYFPYEGEILLQNYQVIHDGQSVQLPFERGNVKFEKIAGYILATQHREFSLAWDGTSGVYIKMTPEYAGRTCGLCGNFNGDMQDDLYTSYGILTDKIAIFGNSWMENSPGQKSCHITPINYSPPCSEQNPQIIKNLRNICAILLGDPFTRCHHYVSPYPFVASCLNDLCMFGADDATLCGVLTEYARSCAQADHPLHEWRKLFSHCVMTCEGEFVFRECIDCCPASCEHEKVCIDSEFQCLDGCYCPEGYIYENGSCVRPTECSCVLHGQLFAPGSTVQEVCNSCICIGGTWNCTDHICPAECSVTGDIHFMTFDKRAYTFQATCQYILAKSRHSGKFAISLQDTHCGTNLDGACIRSVSLVVDEDLKQQLTLTHSGEVYHGNQYRLSLPYRDELFEVTELSSVFVQVKTDFGLRLQYDREGRRLYIEVDGRWKEDTVGLCGTFNGNIQDDFLSAAGMVESTPQLFANSWRISGGCNPSTNIPEVDPCDMHQQAASYATEKCSMMTGELFAPCHQYLSPELYHHQCKADTCKCGESCMCSSLAHYARQCRKHGVVLDFRPHVSECALQCPDTMVYGTCVSFCNRRCQSLSAPETCAGDCAEGCSCPDGTYHSSRAHACVKKSECPCYFLGAEYSPGEVTIQSSGMWICSEGVMQSQSASLDIQCPPGQVYFNCSHSHSETELSRGPECKKTCENLLLNITCSEPSPCLSGCVCPPGLVRHEDECFKPDECPCLWKGKEYFPGDLVTSPCHSCVCQQGTFQCTFQPCPSMCTAYGDRHYKTFDGLLYDFIGACKVYLVKSLGDSHLSIISENTDCYNGAICRKALSVSIGRTFLVFDDDTGHANPSSVIDPRENVHVWKAGSFTVVHFPTEEITLLWDQGTTIHVQVGPRWQGKLSGLCGNFDSKTANEMKTPDHMESPNPQEFGNSWTAMECVNSPDIRNPCNVNPLREPFAKKECGILLSSAFELCHPVVDVTWFYSNCLTDTCACNRGGDCQCFCTSVLAYAHLCCQHGVPIDWRSPTVCPYDCEYYNKVLGNGPYTLVTYLDKDTVVAADSSGGVFPATGEFSSLGIMSLFMLTPGLYSPKLQDGSLVSLEAADRPNYFLRAGSEGSLHLTKWQKNQTFHREATFTIHRDAWVSGFNTFESYAKPGFFVHQMKTSLHLMRYNHSEGFRHSTLFRLADADILSPAHSTCEWRYETCASPCFRTCRDPTGKTCLTLPNVEGCVPRCPHNMMLDEDTQRCVYPEDCKFLNSHNLSFHNGCIFIDLKSHNHNLPFILSGEDHLFSHIFSNHCRKLFLILRCDHYHGVSFNLGDHQKLYLDLSLNCILSLHHLHILTVNRDDHKLFLSLRKDNGSFSFFHYLSLNRNHTISLSHKCKVSLYCDHLSLRSGTDGHHNLHISKGNVTDKTDDRASVGIGRLFSQGKTTSYPFTTSQSTGKAEPPSKLTTSAPTSYLGAALSTHAMLRSTTEGATVTTSARVSAERSEMSSATTAHTGGTERTTITTQTPGGIYPMSTAMAKEAKATVGPVAPGPGVTAVTPHTTPASEIISKTTVSRVTVTPRRTSAATLRVSLSSPPGTPGTTASTSISITEKVTLSATASLSGRTLHTGAPTRPVTTSARPGWVATALEPLGITEPAARVSVATKPSTAAVTETSRSTGLYLTTIKTIAKITTAPAARSTVTPITPAPTSGQLISITRPLSHGGAVSSEYWTVSHKETPSTSVASKWQPSTISTSPAIPSTPHALPLPNATTVTIIAPSTVLTPSPTAFTASRATRPSETSPAAYLSTSKPVAGTTTHSTTHMTALTVPPTSPCTTPFLQQQDDCIQHICVDGHLIQVNRSQNCQYNVTPPSCGFLGFAVQVNGDKCCPQWDCPCRCSIFANLHVITFDGSYFGISGAASYVVVSLMNETVTVETSNCFSQQLITANQSLMNSTSLCLTKLNITHRSNHVIVDRELRRLIVNSRYGYTPFRRFDFEIVDTGSMYTILTPAGVSIQWFHSTGIMVIETGTPNKKLTTVGLCGYCDGNPTNDLTLKNGTVLKETDDPVTFVDDWTVPSTRTGMRMSRRLEVNCTTSDCSECFRMLRNETFSVCHSQVSPEMFCELWVRDSVFVSNPCSALAAYVAVCNKFNICIEWRKSDYCPFLCPAHLMYQACVPTCEAKTCQNRIFFPSEDSTCSILSEGCVCPQGTILHRPDSTLCVPEEKCACTDSWGLPRAAGETWSASLDGCCTYRCLENGTINTVDLNCSSVPVLACHRLGEVMVNLASDRSCCPQKICVCNQTVCERFAPQCGDGERLVSLYKSNSCCPDYFCECDPDKCESDIPVCQEDQTLIATRTDGSCCLAYICMCGSCSDEIPSCQEGEILTVNDTTTEKCCPSYHCVCETYRCPEFKCPHGTKMVQSWRPDQCCPLRSCECACDTLLKPQCQVGEVLQMDEQHRETTVDQCVCPKYKCVNDHVCVDGGRGVLRPGQTIVEHMADSVCHTTQCTHHHDNVTGFYQLIVTAVNCSSHCNTNQVYIPPTDLTRCCGICKNISCLFNMENGTTAMFEPGASWMFNCVMHNCTEMASGPTLIISPLSCPPFNETECLKIGGSVITYLHGCCKSCKEDVKSCQKVVVRMTIRKNDCRSNRPVNIVSCDGKCPSASIYNYSINTHARFCKCCREIGLQKRTVQLYCSGNSTWVNYTIQEPTECSCQWS
ncbi:otogelin [Callorhinchus milii]|uniref:otogelin n=1 Tax=Callorhinchus milii TaxID=7868 RepID=UPI001C3F809B|nr:otogelin [Callorhinchus milii]